MLSVCSGVDSLAALGLWKLRENWSDFVWTDYVWIKKIFYHTVDLLDWQFLMTVIKLHESLPKWYWWEGWRSTVRVTWLSLLFTNFILNADMTLWSRRLARTPGTLRCSRPKYRNKMMGESTVLTVDYRSNPPSPELLGNACFYIHHDILKIESCFWFKHSVWCSACASCNCYKNSDFQRFILNPNLMLGIRLPNLT